MFDIFSRLPLTSISQCRFVCKDWYNYIKDPLFIKLHHSRIKEDNPDFLVLCHSIGDASDIYLVSHGSTNEDTVLKALNIWSSEKVGVAGSSNGLICFSRSPYYNTFSICNPITRETLDLPRAPGFDQCRESNTYCSPSSSGFVFDPTINTYKVIHTWIYDISHGDLLLGTGVEIYTLGSGQWRRKEDIPSCFYFNLQISQVLLNGALHWGSYDANKDSDNVIVAINISEETFTDFKGPPGIRRCLCVVDDYMDDCIVFWVMKDYGVNQSWRKDCVIRKETLGPSPRMTIQKLRSTINGSILIVGPEVRGYYDAEKEEFKHLVIHGIPSPSSYQLVGYELHGVAHTGSLISPTSVGGI